VVILSLRVVFEIVCHSHFSYSHNFTLPTELFENSTNQQVYAVYKIIPVEMFKSM